MQEQGNNKGNSYTPQPYVNFLRAIMHPYLWCMAVFFSWLFAYIYTEAFREGKFNPVNPVTIPFIAGQYLLTGVLTIFLVKSIIDSVRTSRINTFLMADDDGVIYIKDLAAYLKKPEMKTISIVKYLIRKKCLVRLNYNSEEKIILLSDRRVYEKSFIGIHCPGCQAALKVRTNTESLCPICGRKLYVPTVTVVEEKKD